MEWVRTRATTVLSIAVVVSASVTAAYVNAQVLDTGDVRPSPVPAVMTSTPPVDQSSVADTAADTIAGPATTATTATTAAASIVDTTIEPVPPTVATSATNSPNPPLAPAATNQSESPRPNVTTAPTRAVPPSNTDAPDEPDEPDESDEPDDHDRSKDDD